MTPLERAARSLHKDYLEERARMGVKPSDLPQWDDLGEDGRFLFFHKARLVLTAVREPSEEMLMVGAFCQPFLTPEGQKPFTPGKIIAWSCYEAMIDAIISEPAPEKLTQKLTQKAK